MITTPTADVGSEGADITAAPGTGRFPALLFGSERGAGAQDVPEGQLQLFSAPALFPPPIVKEHR